MLHFKIKTSSPKRLDQYLVSQKLATSRSQIAKWIHDGQVTLNGVAAKAGTKLKPGDQILVFIPEVKPSQLKAEAIPLEILYEDGDLIVLNKPAWMVVHPGAGHSTKTLVHALLAHCKGLSKIGGVERPGIVHRLDKGTSGVMVIAKNDETHLALSLQFKNHQVEKIYQALVYGELKKNKGTLSSFLTRSSSHRKKFMVHEQKGKKATTHYEVMNKRNGLTLLKINLETGRTHQIRVHFTHEGHSLVGDPLYGGHSKKLKQINDKNLQEALRTLDHPLLHAASLQFTHPRKNKLMKFNAPLPEDFKEITRLVFSS